MIACADFKKMTYKQLGKFETIDQINAAKYFGSLSYIDNKRIGIQGWLGDTCLH